MLFKVLFMILKFDKIKIIECIIKYNPTMNKEDLTVEVVDRRLQVNLDE
jgi:hypothetical protein